MSCLRHMAQPSQNQEKCKVTGRVPSTCLASYPPAVRGKSCALNGEMESNPYGELDGRLDGGLGVVGQAHSGLCSSTCNMTTVVSSEAARPVVSALEPDMTSGCASTCCQHAALAPLTC